MIYLLIIGGCIGVAYYLGKKMDEEVEDLDGFSNIDEVNSKEELEGNNLKHEQEWKEKNEKIKSRLKK